MGGQRVNCKAGLQFGSRYVVDPVEGQVLDYMPESLLANCRVRNPEVFLGALLFDKWTCNADGRQVIYWRQNRERRYAVTLIDQGHCFHGGHWDFPDAPLRGTFNFNRVYQHVRGWESFEPWLARIQHLDEKVLWRIAESVPPEWYQSDSDALAAMLKQLWQRRSRIRDLVGEFAASSRLPFPKWKPSAQAAAVKR
jgi:hypothetical protein